MSDDNIGLKEESVYFEHAYDETFRILEGECDDVVIPFVNYLFHDNYDETAKIERLRDEHFGENEDAPTKKRITDSHMKISFRGEEKYYHFECESGRYDDSLLIKIVRYDSTIAVDRSSEDGYEVHLEYPHSALIFL